MTIELRSVEFQAPEPGPHLLITGGVHGDEFEPPAAIRQLIERFRAADNPTPLLRGRLTLVPMVNEAAFLKGDRAGDDGLDLARICPGRPDGSVSEQTAHALSTLIRTADGYIDLHSGGTAFSVLPLAGYSLHPDETIRDRQRAMARAFNLPVVWGTAANLEGRSLSVARDAGVPAIYTEYHGSGKCDPAGVQDYFDGCLNVLGAWDMIDHEPPPSRVEQIVEDPRPNSGHMQVCNPSPITGLFEATVHLGDRVAPGDLLGHVSDLTGDERHEIRSQQAGIVLVLRTFSRVRQGESVGVILENPATETAG